MLARYRKIWEDIRKFFSVPKVKHKIPPLEQGYIIHDTPESQVFGGLSAEQAHIKNIEKLELARMERDTEALNMSLRIQHRVMIVGIIGVGIALLSALAAITSLSSKPQTIRVELISNDKGTRTITIQPVPYK